MSTGVARFTSVCMSTGEFKGIENIRVILFSYDDSNTKLGHIWFMDLDPDLVNDNQFKILDLINGIEISDQDKWYNPLMEYINQFNNLVHSKLQLTDKQKETYDKLSSYKYTHHHLYYTN